MPVEENATDDSQRKLQLTLLAITIYLGMGLWFSASAVSGQIGEAWQLTSATQRSWLTISVQLGFVIGTLASALLNLPDRIPVHRLFAISAILGALINGVIPFAISNSFGSSSLGFIVVLLLRILTGVTLAGVYPPGMKLMATWFVKGRGLAIGILVGALTLGSGTPYWLKSLELPSSEEFESWRWIMVAASIMALISGAIAWVAIRPGPHGGKAVAFRWNYFMDVWKDEPLRRANFGYLGHMLELYAMWTWVPALLIDAFNQTDGLEHIGVAAAFGVFVAGTVGCYVAGRYADRIGRTVVTIVSLVISGTCALICGFFFDQPIVLMLLCWVWGFAVVADSAQFSTAVTELCDPKLMGTALTIQTCCGFLLTTTTIYLIPILRESLGLWGAFAVLAIGPAFGIWHMARLRYHPDAVKMANGNR